MKRYVVIQKEIGETPLMALTRWKQMNPEYERVPASYAGRLDPMASGKLLILLGEECKKQSSYTTLDKEYEIEVLLDVGSDTGDALGLITYAYKEASVSREQVRMALAAERGVHRRHYPQFSSKTVQGKPLFLHVLQGTIGEINIPQHEERIYNISTRGIGQLSKDDLRERVRASLTHVPKSDEPSKQLGADFRIEAVRKNWESFFMEAGERSFTILTLRVTCGSGTYMRSLAGRIGESLGTRALALSIKRSKIGKYWRGWWLREF